MDIAISASSRMRERGTISTLVAIAAIPLGYPVGRESGFGAARCETRRAVN